MLGIESVLPNKTRRGMSPGVYTKVLDMMWGAMEGYGVCEADGDLHLILLAGKKSEVGTIDFSSVKERA